MTNFDTDSFSEADLEAEFDRLFPHGFAGPDVLQELAPAGWENSPLLAVFHPSLAQSYEETLRLHRNVCALRRPNDPHPLPPEPTFDEVARDFQGRPVETVREVRELVGQCLWDIFSDGHEVITTAGRVLDLGSFRASGGFLAEILNRQTGAEHYDYLDFYMGTIWVAQRADLTPVYQMIFRRLQRPPARLDLSLSQALRGRSAAAQGSPGRKARSRLAELLSLRSPGQGRGGRRSTTRTWPSCAESLEEGYRESIEEALKGPPPTTVRAYRTIYGCFPRGWPPSP